MTSAYDSMWNIFLRLEGPDDHFLVHIPRQETPRKFKARVFSALRDRVLKEQLFDRWPVVSLVGSPYIRISYKSRV